VCQELHLSKTNLVTQEVRPLAYPFGCLPASPAGDLGWPNSSNTGYAVGQNVISTAGGPPIPCHEVTHEIPNSRNCSLSGGP
jgi:hypothetical protein